MGEQHGFTVWLTVKTLCTVCRGKPGRCQRIKGDLVFVMQADMYCPQLRIAEKSQQSYLSVIKDYPTIKKRNS